jgi:hypothetical protein
MGLDDVGCMGLYREMMLCHLSFVIHGVLSVLSFPSRLCYGEHKFYILSMLFLSTHHMQLQRVSVLDINCNFAGAHS